MNLRADQKYFAVKKFTKLSGAFGNRGYKHNLPKVQCDNQNKYTVL